MVPERHRIRLTQEEDRLTLKGLFEKGQLVMLLLEGQEKFAYFVPTTKRPFLAMCVGTFQDADPRAVEFPISFEGIPAGRYDIHLIVDDKKYETGATVSL